MNNSPIYGRIRRTLAQRRAENLFRTLPPPNRDVDVDLSTNSYLALQNLQEVSDDCRRLAGECFGGNLASRLIETRSTLYPILEEELAAWNGTETALLFNSGYALNLGALQALCTGETEVFSDRYNHASIIDGIRLSGAKKSIYRHCDPTDLRDLLAASSAREKLIVTDSVFSVDGDRAPLSDICELARKYDALLMVDEAHGIGIFGENQSGLIEELGLEHYVDIRMGTLSKAIAGLGGFFAGSTVMKDFLVNHARSVIYSTGLPHPVLAYNLAAVRYIRRTPGLGKELLRRASIFRDKLQALGYDTLQTTTQIVPCLIGDEGKVIQLSKDLLGERVKVPELRPPTVPPGTARLRFSIHLGVSEEQMDFVLHALKKWKQRNL